MTGAKPSTPMLLKNLVTMKLNLSVHWIREFSNSRPRADHLHGVSGPDLAVLPGNSSISAGPPSLEPENVIPAAGQLLRCRCFRAPLIKQRLCHNLCGVHRLLGHSILALVVSNLNLLANILQCFRRYTVPPQPPQHPPPPPPGCPTISHRYYTTTPRSPSRISPSQTASPAGRGYTLSLQSY